MLTFLALGMLGSLITLIMTSRATTLVALVFVPAFFAILGGFGSEIGAMALAGIVQLAPTGVMLAFAILYFSVMSDAGLFDPLIRLIVRIVHGDPVRIVFGSAVLALVISLDGDGSTTYIICCTAMMPLYRQMKLDPLILACLLMLACGITNITPWGGPAAKVASALNLEVRDIFVPLIPGMIAAAFFVLLLGYMLGRQERRRLGRLAMADGDEAGLPEGLEEDLTVLHNATARPELFLVNLALTIALLAGLVLDLLPLPVLFMVAATAALAINYPSLDSQKDRLNQHAPSIFRVISVIFAAGFFVGIFEQSGMGDALAHTVAGAIPARWGPYLAPITGLISIPFTFVMANEGFFFGVLPVLAGAAEVYGISPTEIARAALISQAVHLLSPIVPSTHLLVGLAGVSFGQHQRYTMKWAIILSLIMLATGMATTAIPIGQ